MTLQKQTTSRNYFNEDALRGLEGDNEIIIDSRSITLPSPVRTHDLLMSSAVAEGFLFGEITRT